jgi:ABC-type anion transport system duplicated permease subunit
MTLTPSLRKLTLTVHVMSSVGWFGAVAAFLALAVAALTSQDAQLVRSADLAMDLTAWFVIVPLCFASLLTGLVSSLGTHWGLFRHYWVACKTPHHRPCHLRLARAHAAH